MRSLQVLTIVAAAAIAAGVSGTASAATQPFGHHVAMCAHEVGARADAPLVTCTHDGMTMTFDTFGAMVQHMRGMR